MSLKKEYDNGELTIVWQPDKCTHAGVCVRTLPNVYKPKEKPWINPENATIEELKNQIDKCPSGALSYRMNTSIEITHTDREQNGIFQAFEKGIAMGEITYAWSGKNTFIVTHTGVRPEFEGKGIAKKMFLEVIRYARENQKKIVPLCPFAKVMFERYDEFRDVLK